MKEVSEDARQPPVPFIQTGLTQRMQEASDRTEDVCVHVCMYVFAHIPTLTPTRTHGVSTCSCVPLCPLCALWKKKKKKLWD